MITHQPPTPTLSWFDKLKRSIRISFKSLLFIWRHKKLLFFPLLTACLVMASVGIYEVTYYALYQKHITSFFPESKREKRRRLRAAQENRLQEKKHVQVEQTEQENGSEYAGDSAGEYDRSRDRDRDISEEDEYKLAYILFALIITFVAIFCSAFSNVALSYATTQAFTGSRVNISSSIGHSLRKFFTLFTWTIAAFVIHIMVNMFKGKDKQGRRSFLSRLVGEAIEIAWYVATFLVIPIIAHERIGGFASIKRSAHLMKQKFGENLVSALVLQQVFGFMVFLWLVICIGTMALLAYTGHAITLISMLILCVIGLFFLGLVQSAAVTVFKTAIYHYVTGNPVGPFYEEEMRSQFVSQPKQQQ